MKRLVSIVLTMIIIVVSTVITTSASEGSTVTFYYGDVEVTVSNVGNLEYETLKAIADFVATDSSDDSAIMPCNILCIFGHDLTTTAATKTTHNAYTTSPKCLEEVYSIVTCTRSSCDYFERTLIRSNRIGFCHG